MPYAASDKLPFESASKLGHISVIDDPLVLGLMDGFVRLEPPEERARDAQVVDLALDGVAPLDHVLAVDGSLSVVPNSLIKEKTVAYLKVGALSIGLRDLELASQPIVDPDYVRKLVSENTTTFSTVLPLNNVGVQGQSTAETCRSVVWITFNKVMEGRLLDTLLFLTSRLWDKHAAYDASFHCPFCGCTNSLPRSEATFSCENLECARELTVVDYLGFDREINENSNDDSVAYSLMIVLEHLTLIDYLRRLADLPGDALGHTLVLKDGPLMLPGQYSRLVEPIRDYLVWLGKTGRQYFLAGVEKSGAFVSHAQFLRARLQKAGRLFVPGNEYILGRIKHMDPGITQYGERVLYGAKVFAGLDDRNVSVLNVPTGTYIPDPAVKDLVGIAQTLATLRRLVSRQYQDALVPITAVNSLVSMSFYPSNNILAQMTNRALGSPEGCAD